MTTARQGVGTRPDSYEIRHDFLCTAANRFAYSGYAAAAGPAVQYGYAIHPPPIWSGSRRRFFIGSKNEKERENSRS